MEDGGAMWWKERLLGIIRPAQFWTGSSLWREAEAVDQDGRRAGGSGGLGNVMGPKTEPPVLSSQ